MTRYADHDPALVIDDGPEVEAPAPAATPPEAPKKPTSTKKKDR